jgi:large subunit ribosomal protein L3
MATLRLQLSFGEGKAKNFNKAITGHFKNANTTPKKKSLEFRDCTLDNKS